MGEVGKENAEEGWIIFFFFLVTVHQKAFLSEREAEGEEAEDIEEKMRERKRVKSIPGGTAQLQSCPSECADRVCLRHSGASVIHSDKPHHAAQDKMKPEPFNPEHPSFTQYVNTEYSFTECVRSIHGKM